MRLLFLQYDVVWEDPDANFSKIEAFLDAVEEGFDLCVLPEMFSTGFTMSPRRLPADTGDRSLEMLEGWSTRYAAAFCGSTVYPLPESGGYVNRMWMVQPGGRAYYYDKRHLFRPAGEAQHYAPGAKDPIIVQVGAWRILLQVCYDLRFPVMSHNVDTRYDLAIYVASWPVARRHHWSALLRARAIENQCYVLGVNRLGRDGNGLDYAGDSVLVDADGEVLVDPRDAAGAFGATLDLGGLGAYRRKLPFLRDTDRFELR